MMQQVKRWHQFVPKLEIIMEKVVIASYMHRLG
jgi:hypothetical protein